jgi:hypothetical protein
MLPFLLKRVEIMNPSVSVVAHLLLLAKSLLPTSDSRERIPALRQHASRQPGASAHPALLAAGEPWGTSDREVRRWVVPT